MHLPSLPPNAHRTQANSALPHTQLISARLLLLVLNRHRGSLQNSIPLASLTSINSIKSNLHIAVASIATRSHLKSLVGAVLVAKSTAALATCRSMVPGLRMPVMAIHRIHPFPQVCSENVAYHSKMVYATPAPHRCTSNSRSNSNCRLSGHTRASQSKPTNHARHLRLPIIR